MCHHSFQIVTFDLVHFEIFTPPISIIGQYNWGCQFFPGQISRAAFRAKYQKPTAHSIFIFIGSFSNLISIILRVTISEHNQLDYLN